MTTDVLFNGVSLVGVLTAVFTLIVLCVPKLRKKFAEYIILKHGEDEQVKQIEVLEAKVQELTDRVQELTQQVNELNITLAKYQVLYGDIDNISTPSP